MTYPAVDDLPEEATSTLLAVCSQLSQSRHRGLARWAASVSDALLVQLVTVTVGVAVDVTDIAPPRPLAQLDAADLDALHSLLRAGAEASDDESVVEWCTRMVRMIVADFDRREYEQAAIDADSVTRMSELLEKDRREIEVAVETDVVALEIFEDSEEREVGFSSGFVEPLHSVRPGAVIDDVGQMRVQREGKKSCGPVCRCLRQDGTPQIEFSARGSKELGPACCA